MIQIPLTKGYTAIVDDEDAYLAVVRWQSTRPKNGVVYARRKVQKDMARRTLKLHREVLGLLPGDGKVVDHINGDALDCRRSNLRVVTTRENNRNLGGARTGTSSGFLGVYKRRYGWQAEIKVDGKSAFIGTFKTPEEANVARLTAELKLWGIQPRRRAAFESAGLIQKSEAS